MTQTPPLRKALVADDSPYNRTILSSILRRKNFAVEVAEDGERAVELFAKMNPDIVFLDYIMPRMNGVEVLREIRKRNQQVLVVMVTSISASEEVEAAKVAGANGYVLKPYVPDKIYQTLEKLGMLEKAG